MKLKIPRFDRIEISRRLIFGVRKTQASGPPYRDNCRSPSATLQAAGKVKDLCNCLLQGSLQPGNPYAIYLSIEDATLSKVVDNGGRLCTRTNNSFIHFLYILLFVVDGLDEIVLYTTNMRPAYSKPFFASSIKDCCS